MDSFEFSKHIMIAGFVILAIGISWLVWDEARKKTGIQPKGELA